LNLIQESICEHAIEGIDDGLPWRGGLIQKMGFRVYKKKSLKDHIVYYIFDPNLLRIASVLFLL